MEGPILSTRPSLSGRQVVIVILIWVKSNWAVAESFLTSFYMSSGLRCVQLWALNLLCPFYLISVLYTMWELITFVPLGMAQSSASTYVPFQLFSCSSFSAVLKTHDGDPSIFLVVTFSPPIIAYISSCSSCTSDVRSPTTCFVLKSTSVRSFVLQTLDVFWHSLSVTCTFSGEIVIAFYFVWSLLPCTPPRMHFSFWSLIISSRSSCPCTTSPVDFPA